MRPRIFTHQLRAISLLLNPRLILLDVRGGSRRSYIGASQRGTVPQDDSSIYLGLGVSPAHHHAGIGIRAVEHGRASTPTSVRSPPSRRRTRDLPVNCPADGNEMANPMHKPSGTRANGSAKLAVNAGEDAVEG
jgi:hypothetical protein